ncbi:hypothetical protein [Embleya scabrispora]|uniref:hypothetical protein n=1 Tax=Embleya scabrispora TaxID=159449 RepID=UPI0003805FE7|nr:hypothetical protein [Embleya scabrispora]MYS83730.1 hypothetical protein [Streptomyces sp. SID5474]
MRRIWGEDGGSGLGRHDALLKDARLSVPARGLAVYLLLLPDGARPDPRVLGTRPGESAESIAGYLDELAAAGYLTRVPGRDAHGRAIEEVRLAANPGEHAAAAGRRFRWAGPGHPAGG